MTKTPADEQINTLHYVLGSGWIKDWYCAVDGGANCGDWSIVMSQYFHTVIAFEPAPDTCELLRKNLEFVQNVEIHEKALLNTSQKVAVFHPPKKLSDRARYVKPDGLGTVQAIALDEWCIPECGLLKLDLEGGEHSALLGARDTIARCRPVLIVELSGHGKRYNYTDEETVSLIESMGYKLAHEQAPDKVYVPIERFYG